MSTKAIHGGELYVTENSGASYTVLSGHVLIYLFPYEESKPGRRLFLGEAKEGERIPGFVSETDSLGSWRVGLVALDHAEFEINDNDADKALIMDFARRIGLRIVDASQFEEELIERYNLDAIKAKGYIYASERASEMTRERSLNLIHRLFRKEGQSFTAGEKSGNRLYDTAAYLCARERIEIAAFERVRESAGRRFALHDIARVSHFTVREITLDEKWYTQDSGAILAYTADGNVPVACVPQGPRRYAAYDPETDSLRRIDAAFAAQLKPKAYMFYRPFPEKPVKIKDIFLFGMQKVYRSDMVRLFVLALLGTLIGLLIPYMNEQVYDKFIPLGDISGLAALGSVILACALGNISFTVVKNLATFRSMNSMEYAVQSATFDRLFNLPESFFRQYDAADLGLRAMGISGIYNALAQSIVNTLLSAFFSLLYLWRMFRYSRKMAGVSLVLLTVLLGVIVYIGIRQTKYEAQKMKVDHKANSDIFQFLSGIAKVRSSASEERVLLRYLTKFTESRAINIRKEKMTVTVNTIVGSVQVLFSALFYYVMVRKSIDLSLGAFNGFTAAFAAFSQACLTVVQNYLVVNSVKPLYENAKPILETLPENSIDTVLPGELSGDIEVSNVTFGYDPEEEPVLRGVSFHVRPGEYVGIVGSSGCGKSTLLKLLLGFEKPQFGKVFYDDRDIDEMDKRELRKKFGVVLQDGGLIGGSIIENITITAPGARMARVQEVVREVGLEDDIRQMPMGLNTIISENCGTISGGQAQRILLARAIVGKPKIIFLDEATSALDNVTQKQVTDSLEKLSATKIVIAHRLSTVANCDRILVMDAGQIVEEGTYDELMAKKGRFYELAIRQIA